MADTTENKNLTRQQAMEALEAGNAITHKYFSPGEFIRKVNAILRDETGQELDETDFWLHRDNAMFETGWEVME